MTNKEILKALKLTATILELYGENQFKVRSYNTAVYNLERLEKDLTRLDLKELNELPGVGKSIASIIYELNHSGESEALNNLLRQTPKGILELLKVKGIGARKIKTVWDLLGVETPEDFLKAAQEGELSDLPGFGAKTQSKLLQIISYHLDNKKKKHYKQAHLQGLWLEDQINEAFPGTRISRSGSFRRKNEIVESLEYLWAGPQLTLLQDFLDSLQELDKDENLSGPLRWVGSIQETSFPLDVRFCDPSKFGGTLILHTGSPDHLKLTNRAGKSIRSLLNQPAADEEKVYRALGWPYVPPELREGMFEQKFMESNQMPQMVILDQLKGILHNHSTYSDGKHSLRQMALQCHDLGYQYFGITDHSQTAVYANGLSEEKVREQHREIETLNAELTPFRIFKGIESDILNDGSLDYSDEFLQEFDFVVASIHFNMNMDRKKATERLIAAISNPFTTILGHPTGRQLLKREGYPIDHKAVIDACASYGVIIEINAHPWRLDLEWPWVHYAMDKGVMISINPDAHEKAALEDMYYGVCVARKAGLTEAQTFNALSVQQVAQYFKKRKQQAVSNSTV